jgi:cytochrome c5
MRGPSAVNKEFYMHLIRNSLIFVGTLGLMASYTTAATSAPSHGQQVYTAHCAMCHLTGVSGAPKISDKLAWAPRLKESAAVLHQHALKGYKGMPVHGACPAPTCSDADISAAVDYMMTQVK